MKYAFTAFFLIFVKIVSGQSLDQVKEKRHSIGTSLNIATFERFISSKNSSNVSISEARARFYFSAINNYGLNYSYRQNRYVKFRIGVSIYSENIETRTFEKGFDGNIIDKTIKGKLSYLSIPVSIRLFPFNTYQEEGHGGVYIELGCNSDFIYDEYMTSHNNIPFNKFRPATLPSYVTVYRESVEYKNKDFTYNRSSATIAIGQEIELKSISFFYAVHTQLESFYQLNNTFAKIKTTKYGLLTMGLNYRFK